MSGPLGSARIETSNYKASLHDAIAKYIKKIFVTFQIYKTGKI